MRNPTSANKMAIAIFVIVLITTSILLLLLALLNKQRGSTPLAGGASWLDPCFGFSIIDGMFAPIIKL